jgi:hypothetical protein
MSRIVAPKLGEAGTFEMFMYRGIKPLDLARGYASDPGDYGRGEYWASCLDFAKHYAGGDGQILQDVVRLENALHLSGFDIIRFGREVYGYTLVETGSEARIAAAEAFTKDMKEKGYDGIVTYDYESTGVWGVCKF